MNKKVIDIDSVDLEKLKKKLRWGDGVRIAEKAGCSQNYVWMVLNPESKAWNEDIIRAAIEVIGSRKVEIDEDLADSLVA